MEPRKHQWKQLINALEKFWKKKKKKTIKEENANLITQNTWSIYDHYLEKQLKRDTASTDRNS